MNHGFHPRSDLPPVFLQEPHQCLSVRIGLKTVRTDLPVGFQREIHFVSTEPASPGGITAINHTSIGIVGALNPDGVTQSPSPVRIHQGCGPFRHDAPGAPRSHGQVPKACFGVLRRTEVSAGQNSIEKGQPSQHRWISDFFLTFEVSFEVAGVYVHDRVTMLIHACGVR